jgi:hypothetical protein
MAPQVGPVLRHDHEVPLARLDVSFTSRAEIPFPRAIGLDGSDYLGLEAAGGAHGRTVPRRRSDPSHPANRGAGTVEHHRHDIDPVGSAHPGGSPHAVTLGRRHLRHGLGTHPGLDLDSDNSAADADQMIDLAAARPSVGDDQTGAAPAQEGERNRLADRT